MRRVVAPVVLGAIVAACSSGSGGVTASPTASTTVTASVTAAPETAELRCQDAIDTPASPPEGFTPVLDVVALPAGSGPSGFLEVRPSGEDDPRMRLFAKTGLVVRAGSHFALRVAGEGAPGAWIGWGSPGRPVTRLTVDGCGDGRGWLAFAGGYWVTDPTCVPLIVDTGGRQQRFDVGVGAACASKEPERVPPDT
jgi:hypothetical protein